MAPRLDRDEPSTRRRPGGARRRSRARRDGRTSASDRRLAGGPADWPPAAMASASTDRQRFFTSARGSRAGRPARNRSPGPAGTAKRAGLTSGSIPSSAPWQPVQAGITPIGRSTPSRSPRSTTTASHRRPSCTRTPARARTSGRFRGLRTGSRAPDLERCASPSSFAIFGASALQTRIAEMAPPCTSSLVQAREEPLADAPMAASALATAGASSAGTSSEHDAGGSAADAARTLRRARSRSGSAHWGLSGGGFGWGVRAMIQDGGSGLRQVDANRARAAGYGVRANRLPAERRGEDSDPGSTVVPTPSCPASFAPQQRGGPRAAGTWRRARGRRRDRPRPDPGH